MEHTVLSIGEWRTNGAMIADVARLGLIPEPVFDATYGEGVFWRQWRPGTLVTNDLRKPADHAWDWTTICPEEWVGAFGAVVFDPPYKLNGTPTDGDRFGADEKMPIAERLNRIWLGAANCATLVRPGGYLLVKVGDQVANGKMYWQTDMVTDLLQRLGFTKEAVFHFRHTPRAQRSQVRARNNYSTLLAFQASKTW